MDGAQLYGGLDRKVDWVSELFHRGLRESALVSATLALMAVGCLGGGADELDAQQGAVTDACSSGRFWTGGERGSSKMIPGGDCIGCHIERREGPRYTAAGTVFGQPGDETNCYGVEGVQITIVDATGKTVNMFTNSAGNFYTRKDLTPPYRTSITHRGQTIEMETEVDDFNCANCHTAEGLEGAPGRIFIP